MRALVACLLTVAVMTQTPAELVVQLQGDDEIVAERAFRRLWLLPRDQVPAAALAAVESERELARALALLRHHEQPLPSRSPAAMPATALDDAAARALLRDPATDNDTAVRMLALLQQRGSLDVASMLAALRAEQPTLPVVAAAILRHEWRELPAPLLAGIRQHVAATELVLRVLALAPRPAARAFVDECLADVALPLDVRCLALAATGKVLTRTDFALPLQALREEQAGDGFALALALLPANVADGAVAAVVERLQAGTPLGRLLPLVDRMSPGGHVELLSALAPLPAAARDDLCRHLAAHDMVGYGERARAALDGEIDLESVWLLRAGPLLDRPARIERVVAAMSDPNADPALRLRAFDALVDARVWDPAMRAFVQEDHVARFRRLCTGDPSVLPEDVLLDALGDGESRGIALAALPRCQLTDTLVERVLQLVVVDDGRRDAPAARAAAISLLAAKGSEAAVTAMWEQARTTQASALSAAEFLARRKEPFVHALLLAELAADPSRLSAGQAAFRDELLDHVRIGLLELGDRRQLADLVANAGRRSAAFLRRCRHVDLPLSTPLAHQLLSAMATTDDGDVRVELASWAGRCTAPEVTAALQELWERSADEELREAALRGILAGAGRAAMVERLGAAIAARRVDDRMLGVAWEAIATTAAPLTRDDAALLASLCLQLPLAMPDDDLRRARQFPEGRTGFPMVAAIAERLRHDADDLAPAAFAAAAAAVADDPDLALLARQRLLCLWTALVAVPAQQQAIGRVTAALLPSIPDAADRGGGVAAMWLSAAAEHRGEFGAAAAQARTAIHGLLRGAEDGMSVRVLVGERDPAAGVDPCAALAARPWLCDARQALVAGDRALARQALTAAAEFAGRDAATLAQIESLNVELSR
ncbi:MAG: hypothetical protein IPK26_27810 [Planctomycetes bacterium]|nr:hypothetical protein [Planctomycetota bacterium]